MLTCIDGVLIYCQFGTILLSKYKSLYSWTCIAKCCLRNCGQFDSGLGVLKTLLICFSSCFTSDRLYVAYRFKSSCFNNSISGIIWISFRYIAVMYTLTATQQTCLVILFNVFHYNDVIMGAMTSQITSLTIVYSTVYSDADQRKHQSSASLAFVWGIHRRPVNSPHKWPVTRKMFPFDDVIMPTAFTYRSGTLLMPLLPLCVLWLVNSLLCFYKRDPMWQ